MPVHVDRPVHRASEREIVLLMNPIATPDIRRLGMPAERIYSRNEWGGRQWPSRISLHPVQYRSFGDSHYQEGENLQRFKGDLLLHFEEWRKSGLDEIYSEFTFPLQVNLLLDEKELEKALQDDRKMLATILQSDII